MVSVPPRSPEVDLLATTELLHRHLDEALCEDVFRKLRGKERRRRWTLHRLLEFWMAVILRAPRSLTQLLEEGRRGGDGLVPPVRATPEAFFQRCETLPPYFFAEVYHRFGARILPEALPDYAGDLASLRERIPEVWAIDGSKLDALAHRLKILRDVRSPVLGGCVTALYDIFRGITRGLFYFADAAMSEEERARLALEDVPAGTLLVGDRLYSTVQFFGQLKEHDLLGLARRRKGIRMRRIQRLSRSVEGGEIVEDTVFEAGSGEDQPTVILRRVRHKRGGRVLADVVTNALDPTRLSAQEALALYAKRWSVERLFFDLKEVLSLHHFYAANPNAVAMQVYAAAIVHTAFRVAQACIARDAGRVPEEISPAKFFPRMARASTCLVLLESGFEYLRDANPQAQLRRPDWSGMFWARAPLQEFLVERRNEVRRHRRYCPSRRRWKSLAHVPGGRALT